MRRSKLKKHRKRKRGEKWWKFESDSKYGKKREEEGKCEKGKWDKREKVKKKGKKEKSWREEEKNLK